MFVTLLRRHVEGGPRPPLSLFLGTGSPWWLLLSLPAPPITLKHAHTCRFLTLRPEKTSRGSKSRFSEGKRGGGQEVRKEFREQNHGERKEFLELY
jgi:hypothetical protein